MVNDRLLNCVAGSPSSQVECSQSPLLKFALFSSFHFTLSVYGPLYPPAWCAEQNTASGGIKDRTVDTAAKENATRRKSAGTSSAAAREPTSAYRSVADFLPPSGLGEPPPPALTHDPEANEPRPTLRFLLLFCERSIVDDDGLAVLLPTDAERFWFG